jgi:Protein RETICULATA-related
MRLPHQVYLLSIALLTLVVSIHSCKGLASISPIETWRKQIAVGYERRVAADPSFPAKSVAEVVLAATTQLVAEWKIRRGDASRSMGPEIDFILAGVLTAVYGKYSSMWTVAKTRQPTSNNSTTVVVEMREPHLGSMKVPTNAFQSFLLDGATRPTVPQRLGSLVTPMLPLFRAGVLASAVGYGLTTLMIGLRSQFAPSYVAATRSVNLLYACLYTGTFMAVVSNLRYQLLQGYIEPMVEEYFHKIPVVRAGLIALLRVANGLLGSMLAIAGMRWLGLQRLK